MVMSNNILAINGRSGPLPVELLDPREAMQVWGREAAAFPQTGLWPLLLADGWDACAGSDDPYPESIDDVLSQAATTSKQSLLDKWRKAIDEAISVDSEDGEDVDFDYPALSGPPPAMIETSWAVDGLMEAPKNTPIVRLPIAHPADVCAILPFGSWNECPDDADHVVVWRSWHERFGAVPLSMGRDTVELWLPEPVSDPELAKQVSIEWFLYCPDAVWQGTETLDALGHSIRACRIWSFWWD